MIKDAEEVASAANVLVTDLMTLKQNMVEFRSIGRSHGAGTDVTETPEPVRVEVELEPAEDPLDEKLEAEVQRRAVTAVDRVVTCGDGWKQLYGPLVKRIHMCGGTVIVVKQEFGKLSFRYLPPMHWSEDMEHEFALEVAQATTASGWVCEDCGYSGAGVITGNNKSLTATGTGWIRTLCKECRDKLPK